MIALDPADIMGESRFTWPGQRHRMCLHSALLLHAGLTHEWTA
jgi:hypothetical protein